MKKYHSYLFIISFLCSLLMLAHTAKAQEAVFEITPNVDMEFIFYKLAGSTPDFDKVAENQMGYDTVKMGPETKKRHYDKIKRRLTSKFSNLDVSKEFIVVDIPARLEFVNVGNKGEAVTGDSYLNIFFEDNQPPIFIKNFTDLKVNLIIKDFEKYLRIKLNHEQIRTIRHRLEGKDMQRSRMVRLVIKAKPIKVDTSGPINVLNKEVWLMLTQFAELQIVSHYDENRIYWTETADWLQKDRQSELMNLYKK